MCFVSHTPCLITLISPMFTSSSSFYYFSEQGSLFSTCICTWRPECQQIELGSAGQRDHVSPLPATQEAGGVPAGMCSLANIHLD